MEAFLIEFFSSCPEDTVSLGERIAGALVPGSIVALSGEIGSGKTCLVTGIARGLGITETVTSPTYTIVNEYHGKVRLYHIDAYRLSGDDDFYNTGVLDLLGPDVIVLVEWSERIPNSLPSGVISVHIKITGIHSRVFVLSGLEKVI